MLQCCGAAAYAAGAAAVTPPVVIQLPELLDGSGQVAELEFCGLQVHFGWDAGSGWACLQ
jgi:hypothetical protein